MSENSDLRIAVVDDDRQSGLSVEQAVREFCSARGRHAEVERFENGNAFLDAARHEHFHLVFLDVYLGDADGTQIGAQLYEMDSSCLIVFFTMSDEHMRQAFACHAFEYISKPFDAERVFSVLNDAVECLPQGDPRVEISCSGQTYVIRAAEICSAVSDAHYIRIATVDGTTYRTRMKLGAFVDMAGENAHLLCINRGIAVSMDHVLRFEHGCCVLSDGSRLPIRTRDLKHVEEAVRRHHFDRIHASLRYGR